MPILPLDYSEPFAATLGVMLYPATVEADSRKARAFAAQFLAEPIRRLYDGHIGIVPIAADARLWQGRACGTSYRVQLREADWPEIHCCAYYVLTGGLGARRIWRLTY